MPVGIPKVPFLIPKDEAATWVDIYNRLHRERCLFLCQPLDFEITNNLVGLLVFLTREDMTRNQFLFIHCRGGWVLCGMGLFDMMRGVPPYVFTLSIGLAYSMGSLVLTGGEKGERIAFPHGRVMMHQPISSYIGPEIGEVYGEGDEFLTIRNHVIHLYTQTTGHTFAVIYRDIHRDGFMSPKEAKDHGIVDAVGLDMPLGKWQKMRLFRPALPPGYVWELGGSWRKEESDEISSDH
uniref:ATP-dependent Clp protease proteolytic subunit n=1 Tax=Corydalis temulifolia TaxID=248860 RepID=UPI0018725E3D|nr:ATP-dependent Clp protease proteolytic subunit [Corydalis temulifolia]QOD41541.1 ATP-dependent Clp protease proteolytic subunit [Corydalis temulifolia]